MLFSATASSAFSEIEVQEKGGNHLLEILQIAMEYELLSVQSSPSEAEIERIACILELAIDNKSLAFILNEIDARLMENTSLH